MYFSNYTGNKYPLSLLSTALDNKIKALPLKRDFPMERCEKRYAFKSLDVTKLFGLVATLIKTLEIRIEPYMSFSILF
jgi:hypothetical protein